MLLFITIFTIFTIFVIKLIVNYESFSLYKNQNFNVFVINLDRSTRRMASVKKQLDNEHIVYERFSAVNGSDLNKHKLITQGLLVNNNMDIGAIGCSLSHIGIWKNIIQNQKRYKDLVLVLEDDVIIQPEFKNKINKIIDKNYDFDILYLGGSNIYGEKINNDLIKPMLKNKKSTSNTGMYAMLIRKNKLPYLLKNNIPLKEYIDQNIKNNLFSTLKIFYVYPPLITHNNNIASDRRITSSKKPLTKWFKLKQHKITIV